MANQPVKPIRRFHFGWRGLAIFLLTLVGVAAFSGFLTVHWVERQLLTTDNWVKMVQPLPKNEEVASALSSYTVNKVVSSSSLQSRIEQALPSRISFLAPGLTSQLQSRLTNRVKGVIQSDQFQGVWVLANRYANQALVSAARSSGPSSGGNRLASFNLNLSSLKNSISSYFGQDSPIASSNSGSNTVSLAVSLKTSFNRFKTFVKTTDFLDGILGLAALACLLGAFIVAVHRRKLLLILSAVIVVVALIELIVMKAGRQALLGHVQNASYQPAVGVVFDTLFAMYRRGATLIAVTGSIIFAVALLTQASVLNSSTTLKRQLSSYSKSQFMLQWHRFRSWLRHYRFMVMGVIILIGLLFMAFVLNLNWQDIIRSVLVLILAVECVSLVAARPRRQPMKQ